MDEVPKILRAFECHGGEFNGTSGDEWFGVCPFCIDSTHFYANGITGQFDCKKCGESGNVPSFLKKHHAEQFAQTPARELRRLANLKPGVTVAACRAFKVAWDGESYLLPCFRGESVVDLRRWTPGTKAIRATAGCKTYLFGTQHLEKAGKNATAWLCEGEWDAMTLWGLFKQAGKQKDNVVLAVPGAHVFKRQWLDLFARRTVRLCYDNDEAGDKGSAKAAAKLGGVASEIKFVSWPDSRPPGFDVRDFINSCREEGLSPLRTIGRLKKLLSGTHRNTNLERQIAETASTRGWTDPHQLSEQLLERTYRLDGILTLRYFKGGWFSWEASRYRSLAEDEMRARTNRHLRQLLDEVRPHTKVGQGVVANVLRAVEGLCLVPGTVDLPAWLGDSPRPGPGDLLAMANGLLDFEGALKGQDDVLHDPTPAWFSLTRWAYGYDPAARCPMWKRFLKEVLPDIHQRKLLQEYIGNCLNFDTSHHKFLVLAGEGANGKSVATDVITNVVGPDNVTHLGLERFHQRFAVAPTIGKLANIVSEIALMKGAAEDILKAIVSGDRIQVEFKYQTPTEARPTVRLIFATNEPPQFADRSEAIWRRIIILPFEVMIPENRQDKTLARKICANELPGIFNWALAGLRRLRSRGNFRLPESARKAIAEHRLASNPARQFLKEQCESSPDATTRTTAVYDAYENWCNAQRIKPLTDKLFGREVRRVYPGVERKQKRFKDEREYYYVGLKYRSRFHGLRR